MKLYKRILASFLAFLMVAGGLYFVQTEDGSETVQAATSTDVSTDMLDLKAQIATDDSGIIRFISSVDSLKYNKVGFEVTPKGGTTKVYETTTVYERIVSAPDATSVKYEFGPKVVDVTSEYFVTAKLRAQAGVDYTVRAFVQTFAGQMVYGKSRCVALSDGAESATTVNMAFENTASAGVKTGDVLTVAYGTDNKATTATVIGVDGATVHVRVKVDVDTLPSATKFTFSGAAAGSVIYRNLYTTHVPTSGTEANADTTWYDVYLAEDSKETEFVIATTADLYGFASLVTAGKSFEGKTAYLCADLTVNTNIPSNPNVDTSWDGYTAQYMWAPIGNYNNQFKGEFDGGDHIIKGLYTSITENFAGFFGSTDAISSVHNVQIKDSCFKTAATQSGTISGRGGGNFYQIYSNAVVMSTSLYSGGILGLSDEKTVVEECWFAGTTSADRAVGGMVGFVGLSVNEVSIDNCLVSGKVIGTKTDGYTNIGGLVGWTDQRAHVVTTTNCLVTGTYESPTGGVGEYVGQMQAGGTLHIKGCYVVLGNYPEKLVGAMSGTYGTNSSNGRKEASLLTGSAAYTNTILGFEINQKDENQDNVWIAVENSYPELKRFSTATALDLTANLKVDTKWYTSAVADKDGNAPGTEKNPYIVKDADDLYGLAELVNKATDNFADKYIVVANDITMNVNTPDNADKVVSWENYTPQIEWKPIGTTWSDGSGKDHFYGNFDGQGHTISGLYTEETNNERWTGLFGITADAATVKNLTLVNSYFEGNQQTGGISSRGGGTFENITCGAVVVGSASSSYTGSTVGGIFGQTNGNTLTIENCHFTGETKSAASNIGGIVALIGATSTASIKDCSVSGSVASGSGLAGGIAGLISGTSTVDIIGCTTSGTVSAVGEIVGGMVGQVSGSSDVDIEACAFTGSSTTVNNRRAGGFIGFVDKANVDITTSLSSGTVSAIQRVGGFIGEAMGADGGVATVVTITDCLSEGTTTTTNDGHQQHGGFIGYLIANATAKLTRCLMVGKMVYPTGKDMAKVIVGKVEGTAGYDGSAGVYMIDDADYFPTGLGFIGLQSITGNGGWIGGAGAGQSRKTEEQLTGANAVENLPLLQISTDSAGTSTWVATKTGFPTLRIFADTADIYTK